MASRIPNYEDLGLLSEGLVSEDTTKMYFDVSPANTAMLQAKHLNSELTAAQVEALRYLMTARNGIYYGASDRDSNFYASYKKQGLANSDGTVLTATDKLWDIPTQNSYSLINRNIESAFGDVYFYGDTNEIYLLSPNITESNYVVDSLFIGELPYGYYLLYTDKCFV